ncbi:MAG TPA: dipeptidase PepV [Bacillales bacterium]|nr:dipeptidase PepV [Bacillales bacterium]
MKTKTNWHEEVLKRKEDLLEDLMRLLEIRSVKDLTTQTPKWPMGREIGEALEHMLKLSANDGFAVKNIEGYAGHAEIGNSDDYVGVLCHLDVVPAPGRWETPPFEPAIRDGKLYARGAIDDKGPTMAAYYAMKILKELDLPLKRKIRLIFGTDEESGMRCMKKYREVESMPAMGFAPDAVFPIIHAEKGQINATLCLEKGLEGKSASSIELLHFTAGEKGNMVPGQARATVKSHDIYDIESGFLKYCQGHGLDGKSSHEGDSVILELQGRSVHGMEPYNGVNAGTELAQYLVDFPFEGRAKSFLHFVGHVLHQDFHGEYLGIAVSDEVTGPLTVNPGVLRFSQVEVSVKLNIRCPVSTPYLRIIEILMEMCRGYGFKVDEIREKKPHHVDPNHPMIRVMQKVYQEETGEPGELLSNGGATYARFIDNGVAFGAVFPGREMTAHQVDESIEINDLLKATAIYARTLYELANL